MTELTKTDIQFLIGVLQEINVSAKNPNAQIIISNTQNCINKLNKMVDEISVSESKVDNPDAA